MVGPSIGTTSGRTDGDASHRLRNRHRDASLSNSLPRRRTSVCVCVCTRYGDGIDGDRVGSVLLLLPCHTVTRNGQVARVRVAIFSSSSTETRKNHYSAVCVCDGLLSSEKSLPNAEIFRFSLSCVKSYRVKTEQFFLRQTCGNLSPANWTSRDWCVLNRTSATSKYTGLDGTSKPI